MDNWGRRFLPFISIYLYLPIYLRLSIYKGSITWDCLNLRLFLCRQSTLRNYGVKRNKRMQMCINKNKMYLQMFVENKIIKIFSLC